MSNRICTRYMYYTYICKTKKNIHFFQLLSYYMEQQIIITVNNNFILVIRNKLIFKINVSFETNIPNNKLSYYYQFLKSSFILI